MFTGWNAAAKSQRNLSLNAAPVDVADYLRRRLFESDTSIVMTSATLATNTKSQNGLNYFSRRVGCESATMLQVGTPFDYERQMKLFTVKKMSDPREHGYAEALEHWIAVFREADARQGVRALYQATSSHAGDSRRADAVVFRRAGPRAVRTGHGHVPALGDVEKFTGDDTDSVLFGTDSFWQGVDVPGEAALKQRHHHAAAVRRARTIRSS